MWGANGSSYSLITFFFFPSYDTGKYSSNFLWFLQYKDYVEIYLKKKTKITSISELWRDPPHRFWLCTRAGEIILIYPLSVIDILLSLNIGRDFISMPFKHISRENFPDLKSYLNMPNKAFTFKSNSSPTKGSFPVLCPSEAEPTLPSWPQSLPITLALGVQYWLTSSLMSWTMGQIVSSAALQMKQDGRSAGYTRWLCCFSERPWEKWVTEISRCSTNGNAKCCTWGGVILCGSTCWGPTSGTAALHWTALESWWTKALPAGWGKCSSSPIPNWWNMSGCVPFWAPQDKRHMDLLDWVQRSAIKRLECLSWKAETADIVYPGEEKAPGVSCWCL